MTSFRPSAPVPHGVMKALPVIELSDGESSTGSIETSNQRLDEEEGGDDWQDSDTDSYLCEIMNGEDDIGDFDENDPAYCTSEEIATYRRRLRRVGPSDFVHENITRKIITAKKLLTAFGVRPPLEWDGYRPDVGYYRLLGLAIARELTVRLKLPEFNTIDDATQLFRDASHIMVITGAGISTNLGIPDFRSKDTGFYAQMEAKGFSEPQEIFELGRFLDDPSIFYENAGETLATTTQTSPTHAFLRLIQDKGKLLTVYTQNIDNIEGNVGIDSERLVQCHGSWATATCMKCNFRTPGHELLSDVKAKRVPRCKRCMQSNQIGGGGFLKRKRASNGISRSKLKRRESYEDESDDGGMYDVPEPGIMKPDIIFFGEKLPPKFFDRFKKHDQELVDLVVIIGTSMKVAPVSEIPMAVSPEVPHIYISHDRVRHLDFDITLLGDCDVIVGELSRRLGWKLEHPMLPEKRDVDIVSIDEEKAIWAVKPRI